MLLVRKENTGAFMQPGGKIDEGESSLQALVRELYEELSLEVNESELNWLGSYCADAANEPNMIVQAEVFAMKTDKRVKPGAEIAEVFWYPDHNNNNIELAPLTRDKVLPAIGLA